MSATTNGPTNGIRVSNREIYDALMELKEDVRELQHSQKEIVERTLGTHAERLRGLELKFYGILAGLVAVLVTLGAQAVRT